MACCLVWQGGDLMDAIAKDTKGDLRWDRNGASLAIDVVRGLCHLHSKNVVSAQILADVVCCDGPSEAQRGVCIEPNTAQTSQDSRQGSGAPLSRLSGALVWAATAVEGLTRLTLEAECHCCPAGAHGPQVKECPAQS